MKKRIPTLFDERIIATWWQLMEEGIANGVLASGADYLIEGDQLFLHFESVHQAYVRRLVETKGPRELLLPPPQMRRVLSGQKDFLYTTRKRMGGEDWNVRAMVFLWNKQVRLPARKLRKVG